MTDWDEELWSALTMVCMSIDYRCLAAQESGRKLAEHHRRALGQRWRRVERELLPKDRHA